MKYVRFQSQLPISGTGSNLGIFQIAFMVRDADETRAYDRDEIASRIEWLKMHLRSPNELDDPENYRAICWFKEAAREPMKRIWEIRPFLEAYGYWIEVVKTRNPGVIVYEDGWQIAAKPERKARRRR